MIKGIAFDLEATIVNLEKFHFDAFVLASEQLGFRISFQGMLDNIPFCLGGGDQRIAEGVEVMSQQKIKAADLLRLKLQFYENMLTGVSIQTRPGFREVFHQIAGLGFKVAIGSLTPVNQARGIIERLRLTDLIPMENIVLREDVKDVKPAPDVWLETARRMGISSHEQLVFDDSAAGNEAARRAGSKSIAMPVYDQPQTLKGLVDAGACRVFMDWREMNVCAVIARLNMGVER